MSVVYTADVFCDGDDCSLWAHGVTNGQPPTKAEARDGAKHAGFVHYKGKDYCRQCWRSIAPSAEWART